MINYLIVIFLLFILTIFIVPLQYVALILLAYVIGYKACLNMYYSKIIKAAIILKEKFGDDAIYIINKELK